MQTKSHESKPRRLGRATIVLLIVVLLGGVAIAVLIRGNHTFFMKNKCHYLISRGLYKEALDLLRPLNQRYPSDPTVLHHMLLIHNHLGDNEKAFALAKQLENMAKPDREVYWALGIHSLLARDLDAAKNSFSDFPITEPLSRLDRDTYRVPFVQGIIAYVERDYQSAERFLIDALNEDDDVYLTHLYLAETYINRGRTDQAEDFLGLTNSKFPEKAEPCALLASLYYQEGDMDRARFYLDNAQFRGLNAYEMLVTDMSTTSGLYTHKDFGECFRQLVDGRIYSSCTRFAGRTERMYGEILLHLRMGKYQEAKDSLETLRMIQPEIPGVNYLMALIVEQIDGPEQAKELLYREVEINPWNFNAYLRYRQLSPGASDSQTSPAIALVKENLEGRTVGEKRAKTDFAFNKENNNEVKALVSNGTARTTMQVSSDGVYLLTVIARGMSAGGIWPLMYVKIDESDPQAFYADSPNWRAYSIPVNIYSGSHTVEIEFANDKMVTAGGKEEDCNLFIQRAVLLHVPPRDLLGGYVTY